MPSCPFMCSPHLQSILVGSTPEELQVGREQREAALNALLALVRRPNLRARKSVPYEAWPLGDRPNTSRRTWKGVPNEAWPLGR